MVKLLAFQLLGTNPKLEPMPTYHLLDALWKLELTLELTKIPFQEDAFQNTVCNMSAILFRTQCVKGETGISPSKIMADLLVM